MVARGWRLDDSDEVARWCVAAALILVGGCGASAPSETSLAGTRSRAAATPTSPPTTRWPIETVAPDAVVSAVVLGSPLPIDGAVPVHGIAYSTAAGVVVAGPDGVVRARVPGYRIADRSLDTTRIAAVVAPVGQAASGHQRYALIIGSASIAPIESGETTDISSVQGWTAERAPVGCLRDARRLGSPVVLCAATAGEWPRRLRRVRADGGLDAIAEAPPTAMPGTGHWADAIAGPHGDVAATWSGDCESRVSYRAALGQELKQLTPGESAVLAWDGDDVLVERFGGCGPATPDDGLYRIDPQGIASRVPTPDADEVPVAW